jgi:pyrroline-5-carboxylate reductase
VAIHGALTFHFLYSMIRSYPYIARASARCSDISKLGSPSVFKGCTRAWLSTVESGMYDKITFLGAGKMAQAMIAPLIKKGYQPEAKVCVYDVSNSAMKSMKENFPSIQLAESITDAVSDSDLIVLAVKPQNINESFFAQFPKDMREDTTLVSILAGKPISEFEPSGIKKICRAMPNTPATIGEGMTVWSCTPNLTSGERDHIKKIMGTFGKEVSAFWF